MPETVEHYLARSLIKDAMKGGNGWRSVREVANVCGPRRSRMIWAARQLAEAAAAGRVEEQFMGHHPLYRSTMTLEQARDACPAYNP